MAGSAPRQARTVAAIAHAATKQIAQEQQQRPGRKVPVVAVGRGGFDGLKFREPGDKFVAWWPAGFQPPTWQQERPPELEVDGIID